MTRTKALFALVILLGLSAGFADVQVFRLAARMEGANHALCAFRRDVQDRFESGVTYLATHPQGIPGVPIATLHLSLSSEQHTLTALRDLQCP